MREIDTGGKKVEEWKAFEEHRGEGRDIAKPEIIFIWLNEQTNLFQ